MEKKLNELIILDGEHRWREVEGEEGDWCGGKSGGRMTKEGALEERLIENVKA